MARTTTIERRRALFEEAADLDDVARRVAASRRQLQRCFAEAAGTTFREYLSQVRMRKARELLADGSIPVREVARRVGYRQPAQFAKAFRRHYGAPPSRFRGSADGGG
jgi:AraC family transcriptional regulator, regulatory protein of adaptative response / methylphosphotriester-DNA alkyltransferase methyltransferase